MRTHRTAVVEKSRGRLTAPPEGSLGETKTVKLYTTPGDSRGARIRAWLEEHGTPYQDHDVVSDPKALRQMIHVSHSRYVPVVEVGEQVLVGFDENRLAATLLGRNETARRKKVRREG